MFLKFFNLNLFSIVGTFHLIFQFNDSFWTFFLRKLIPFWTENRTQWYRISRLTIFETPLLIKVANFKFGKHRVFHSSFSSRENYCAIFRSRKESVREHQSKACFLIHSLSQSREFFFASSNGRLKLEAKTKTGT